MNKPFLNKGGFHGQSAGIKPRPCLRCDRKFSSPPEIRICARCKNDDTEYRERSRGVEYARTITKPINTRGRGA